MHRRSFIGVGATAGIAALAGCGSVMGESQEAIDAIDSAATDLLDAHDLMVTQYEKFARLTKMVEYDVEAVSTKVTTAEGHLDTAAAEARLDETKTEIENLRSVATFLSAVNEAGVGIATGNNEVRGAVTSLGEGNYDVATTELSSASGALDGVETYLTDADDARERIAADALQSITVSDLAGMVEDVRRKHDSLALIVSGFTPFVKGDRERDRGVTEYDSESYGLAMDSFEASSDFFESAREMLASYDADAVTESARSIADALTGVSATMTGLMDTMVALCETMIAFNEAVSYIGSSRYDDAVAGFETVERKVDAARESLDAAPALTGGDSAIFSEIEVDNYEQRLGYASDAIDSFDDLIPGLIDYTNALQALEQGVVAGDAGRYSEANSRLDTAISYFDDAETKFAEGERAAPRDLRSAFVGLVCNANALSDAARLFSEGYTALSNDDSELAQQKFQEAGQAINRCSSGATSAALTPPTLP